ncbi:MAG: transposase, partial [Chloroflexi bacterium]|nr:transposase [Chloroflexota bacterium]
RRAFLEGGTFFFTVVTYKRRPILKEQCSIDLLKQSFRTTMATMATLPFRVDAVVVLPDHLHTIWTLPDDESDFSTRWKLIKGAFSRRYSGAGATNLSESMRVKGEKGIWQRRFWEHAIRDQKDFDRHCDYIHYNPVKHGLVVSAIEWKHSSFLRFVEEGIYEPNWGSTADTGLADMGFE